MQQFRLLLLLPLAFSYGTMTGCDNSAECACTLEFRSFTVLVVDASETPVEGLSVTIRNERTGDVLDPTPVTGEQGDDGIYTIITDSEINTLATDGDTVTFEATGGGLTAEASFVFGSDACRCHVVRISGPETITAQ